MRTQDLEVIGIAHNGRDALEFLESKHPDIILLDIRMPGMSGVEAVKRILELHPGVRIMMLTTFDDDVFVYDALKNGAVGYLLKTIPPNELIAAIRAIMAGLVQMSPSVAQKLVRSSGMSSDFAAFRPKEDPFWLKYLSPREKAILHLVLDGASNKDIGDSLHIAEQTVKNHLSTIYSKMNVSSRAQVIKALRESGVEL
jgi:DNA-binding NarL/FixJ family response regulator